MKTFTKGSLVGNYYDKATVSIWGCHVSRIISVAENSPNNYSTDNKIMYNTLGFVIKHIDVGTWEVGMYGMFFLNV